MTPKTPQTARTASLYCRLSAASDADGTGLHSQEEDLRRLAAARGLTVIAVHKDDGKSGALRNRPAFLAWLKDARDGRADHLLAWKLDRVSRGGSAGLAEFLDTLSGVDREGRPASPPARFLSVSDSLDSASPTWDIQAAVMGALAKGERDAISARLKRHRIYNVGEDRVVGGRRPWPYATAPKSGGGLVWVPVPERAEAIRWAAEELLAGRVSLAEVAREWDRRGLVPSGGGVTWRQTVIGRLLRSPVLAGATVHHGQIIRNEDQTMRISPERVILELGEWRRLQLALDARSQRRTILSAGASLLQGLLHCASCGRGLYANRPAKPGSTKIPVYHCANKGCPLQVSVSAARVEPFVTAAFLGTFGALPVVSATVPAPEADPAEVAELTDALEAVAAQIAATNDDDEAMSLFRTRRNLRERLTALQETAQAPQPRGLIPFRESGQTYGDLWEEAETERDRAELLASVWTAIEIRPGQRGGGAGRGRHGFDSSRVRFVESVERV